MTHRLLPLAALAVVLAACDRPLIDEIPPDLAVVSPDLSLVQLDPEVTLSVSATALNGIERVRIGGLDAVFDADTQLWEADVFLSQGTNVVLIEAFATDDTARQDTAYAVHLPLEVESPPAAVLPEPRSGHTATRLSGRTILLAGGATTDGRVLGSARILTDAENAFSVGAPIELQTPRVGHTATRLLDGRILLLGGTSTPDPGGASTFVTSPEVYDPRTQTASPVRLGGEPIQRVNHIATHLTRDNREYVYVYGGQTPGPNTPATLQIAELRSGSGIDSLVTRTPAGGASGGTPLPDPTQWIVGSAVREVTAVETGLEPGAGLPVGRARRTLFSLPGTVFIPFSVNPAGIGLPQQPRSSADGDVVSGLALLAGGVSPSGETLGSLEAYSDRAGRWVGFPPALSLRPRQGHTVTLTQSGRILAIGGRGPSGQPLATLDVLSF